MKKLIAAFSIVFMVMLVDPSIAMSVIELDSAGSSSFAIELDSVAGSSYAIELDSVAGSSYAIELDSAAGSSFVIEMLEGLSQNEVLFAKYEFLAQ